MPDILSDRPLVRQWPRAPASPRGGVSRVGRAAVNRSRDYASARMSARADVIVLGAGMVGVSVALHLQRRGRDVALIDRRGAGEETSYGNAGLTQHEAVIPYTFPLKRARRRWARSAERRRVRQQRANPGQYLCPAIFQCSISGNAVATSRWVKVARLAPETRSDLLWLRDVVVLRVRDCAQANRARSVGRARQTADGRPTPHRTRCRNDHLSA